MGAGVAGGGVEAVEAGVLLVGRPALPAVLREAPDADAGLRREGVERDLRRRHGELDAGGVADGGLHRAGQVDHREDARGHRQHAPLAQGVVGGLLRHGAEHGRVAEPDVVGQRGTVGATQLGGGDGVDTRAGGEPAGDRTADTGGQVAARGEHVLGAAVHVDERVAQHRHAGARRDQAELVVAAARGQVVVLGRGHELGAGGRDRGEVGLVRAAGHGTLAVGLRDRDGLLLDGQGRLAGLLHLGVRREQGQRGGALGARVGHGQAAAVEDVGPRCRGLRRRAADQADGRLGEHVGDRRTGPAGRGQLALPGRAVRDPDLGQRRWGPPAGRRRP